MQRDVFAASCTAAGLPVGTVVEQRHLIDGTCDRPGDAAVAAWREGRSWAFDNMVTSPVAATHTLRASQQAGYAAAQGEQYKIDKNADKCRQAGLGFTPLLAETFGGWGQQAMSTFSQLSSLIAARSGTKASDELRWMYQRHSVALQRDNARMILARRAAGLSMQVPV